MNTQLKLLLEEMIKNKVPAEVNGIETKVALREVKPEFYAYDKYTEKDIKIIICLFSGGSVNRALAPAQDRSVPAKAPGLVRKLFPAAVFEGLRPLFSAIGGLLHDGLLLLLSAERLGLLFFDVLLL